MSRVIYMYVLVSLLPGAVVLPSYAAEQTVFSAVDESETEVGEVRATAGIAHRFALALAGSLMGRPSEAKYRADNNHPFSDYAAAVEGRYYVRENLAVSLSMSVFSKIAKRELETGGGEYFHVHPTLFGARYQWGSAFQNSRLRPYLQAEVGPTWIERSFDNEPYSTEGQFALRGAGGMDVFLSKSASSFAGFQLSYLKSKDLAFAQTTVSLGLMF